jgi:hypothetical protein
VVYDTGGWVVTVVVVFDGMTYSSLVLVVVGRGNVVLFFLFEFGHGGGGEGSVGYEIVGRVWVLYADRVERLASRKWR